MVLLYSGLKGSAQNGGSDGLSYHLARGVMENWKGTGVDVKPAKWTYEQGVLWLGMMRLWYSTGGAPYCDYAKRQVDQLVDKDGNIAAYEPKEFSLDNVLPGRVLLDLYEVTLDVRYYRAAVRLREQLKDQPRTTEGNFWHKGKYPQQVWLDGLYMGMPFLAQYAALFHEDSVFDDIAHQFAVIERHARDTLTGLLYHGWDESGLEKWAVKTGDQTNGHSPNFWGRAMGWFGMALVDALDYFPKSHPGRDTLAGILRRYAEAVRKAQDSTSGVWWDVLDKRGLAGNFPEASASAMFVYTLARGVKEGYLPESYGMVAERGYSGIRSKFILQEDIGHYLGYNGVAGTVKVSGLGGSPYRDGTYAYYTGETVVDNDPKGVAAVLLAAVAMDELMTSTGRGDKTVLLDCYFNNERRIDITGASIRYHYTWEDRANSGFSLWGHLFRQYGAHTDTLPVAPTAENLRRASVYIIVDPDDDREVPDPHYLMPKEIGVIDDWVKAGGVLVLMSNDSANAEFEHFNRLAGTFGIQFNWDDYHKVIGNDYSMGAFEFSDKDSIFRTTHKAYVKEMSTLSVKPPAYPVFTDGGHVIMAVAKVGKGTVFAVGDPWFYNEYTDGRKLPPEYQNYNAARDLAQWLLRQAH